MPCEAPVTTTVFRLSCIYHHRHCCSADLSVRGEPPECEMCKTQHEDKSRFAFCLIWYTARPLIVRRSEVRELVQQVTVRPNLICHVSVRVYRKEKIDNVIGQRPAIVRKARRLARMIGKNIWQQLSCDGLCLLRSIAARVFQLVREHADETIIIRWLPGEVCLPLLSNEENRLQWSCTSVCLDPAFPSFVHRASPDPHFIASQIRVGQFNHDAANIFVDEEVVPGELHVIEIVDYVQKERIAAPAEEKTEVADFRHQGFSPD